MEWDKVYVEIDNDANGTESNENESRDRIRGRRQSPTERQGNRRTSAIGMSASQSTYDYDAKAYGMMSGESCDEHESHITPNFSNVNSKDTMGSFNDTYVTSGASSDSSHSDGERTEAPTIATMTTEGGTTIRTLDVEMAEDSSKAATAFSITRNGKYLSNNHFANAQLMRWKLAAEEGPCFIQNLVFLAALSAIFTTLYPIVTDPSYWTVPLGITAFHTTIFCLVIMTFEIRVWGARNPMSLRSKIRNTLVRHLSILRLVWARGVLYIYAGSMNITMLYYPYDYFTGGSLIALGLISILMGAHAAFNLERLRLSLTDHVYLWNKFSKADSDDDNLIGIDDFSQLIWSLGLELDDSYTYRAFQEIDHDYDGVINFYQFKRWWISSQDDDGTMVTLDTRRTFETNKGGGGSLPSRPWNHTRRIPDHINT